MLANLGGDKTAKPSKFTFMPKARREWTPAMVDQAFASWGSGVKAKQARRKGKR